MDSGSLFGMLLALSFPMLGGNELADYVPPEQYWKAKGVSYDAATMMKEFEAEAAPDISALVKQLGADSFNDREEAMRTIHAAGAGVIPQLEQAAGGDDPEIVDRARRLLKRFGERKRSSAERQTLAIRALGEMKHRGAVPLLQKIAAGRDVALAAQAARAIAQIEGRPATRVVATAQMREEELALLPRDCWFVGQVAAERPLPLDYEQLTKRMNEALPNGAGGDLAATMERAIMKLFAMFGNARVDVVTAGVAGEPFFGGGYGVIALRGHYDRPRVQAQFAALGGTMTEIEGVPVITLEDNMVYVALVSPERIAIVVVFPGGPDKPVRDLLAAVKRNRRGLDAGEELTALVSRIDRRSALWAACAPPESLRGLIAENGVESFTVEIGQEQRDERSTLAATVTLDYTTEDAGREAMAAFEKSRASSLEREERRLESAPYVKPMVELYKTIVGKRDGKTAVYTARCDDPTGLLLIPLFEMRHTAEDLGSR